MKARGGLEDRIVLKEDINSIKDIFDNVKIIEPTSKKIIEIDGSKLRDTKKTCDKECPLKNDKCGCICPVTVATGEDRCRFTYDSNKAFFAISRLIKIHGKKLVLFMEMRITPEFSFGAYSETEAVQAITEISSNLVIDPLTGIFNRKFFTDKVEFMLAEAKRDNVDLCMASIDIDNFKKFNDSYGHDFGDEVLKLVAKCMVKITDRMNRGYSIRYGGDEFIIIAFIDKRKFKADMNKLLIDVSDAKLRYEKDKVGVLISIGVASMNIDNCSDYKELYKKADENLYKAKNRGKGCVV
jgi:response regulator protein